ncbi:hypothetical protein BDZ89DRAFT_1250153 [Hymenopellis radicata]|nr:hypothetical protein BDZ89DRAFT_1250153 [Hymenopellis radicata]
MDRPQCSRHVYGRNTEKQLIYVELINDICVLHFLDYPTDSYTLDDINMHYPAFLREVVSYAEWRSYCDGDRQCRICRLPDELCIRDSVEPATIAVDSLSDAETAVDAHIPLLRHTPTPEPELLVYDDASPSPPPRPRCLSTPSDDSDDSMDDVSTTSYSPSPPPPHRTQKKSTQLSKTRSRGTQRKTTARVHAEYDRSIVAASEIKTIENSPVSGPAKTLHEAIFDHITRSPPDRWIAIIALLTNRQFKQVSCWFMNRRCKLEAKLLEESDPKWRSYYRNVDFNLPDGSMIPMRASALERWSSYRWTDEDFERVIQEEFIPNLDVLEEENQVKRKTVPWYGHAKKRFPPDGRVKTSEGRDGQRRKAATRQ